MPRKKKRGRPRKKPRLKKTPPLPTLRELENSVDPVTKDVYLINIYDQLDLDINWLKEGSKRALNRLEWAKKEITRLRMDGPPFPAEKVVESKYNADQYMTTNQEPSVSYINTPALDELAFKGLTNSKPILFNRTLFWTFLISIMLFGTLLLFVYFNF